MGTKEDDADTGEESVRDSINAAIAETQEPETEATPSVERTAEASESSANEPSVREHEPAKVAETPTPKSEEKTDSEPKNFDPPARWTKEQKEEFAALDPNVQRILMTRNKGLEADYTQKMQAVAQERQRYGALEGTLSQHRESWSKAGMDDAQAMNMILGYWQQANSDPKSFIQTFARERNIDLAEHFAPSTEEILNYLNQQNLAEGGDGHQFNYQADPDTRRQLQTLSETQQQLMARIEQQQQVLQAQQQYQSESINEAASQELHSFQNATDEHGQPLHPFFHDVKADMATLITSGIAPNLEAAYQKAVRMNDDVFRKVRESEEVKMRRELELNREKEAEQARRASSSLAGNTSNYVPRSSDSDDDGDMSVRQLLERGFAKANMGNRI